MRRARRRGAFRVGFRFQYPIIVNWNATNRTVGAHAPLSLLHKVPGFMGKVPVLTRRYVYVISLCVR